MSTINQLANELPECLRNTLIEFSMAYLLEQSDDIVGFAVNYFKVQQRNKKCVLSKPDESMEGSVDSMDAEDLLAQCSHRRMSVSAEPYSPEIDDDDRLSIEIYPKTDEQRSSLKRIMARVLMFNNNEFVELDQVVDKMFSRKVLPGEIVAFEDSKYFYVIESGKFRKYINGKLIQVLDNNGTFGEVALLFDAVSKAVVFAETNGLLWLLDRKACRQMLLKASYRRRKMYEDLLRSIPVLTTSLSTYERMIMADALVHRTYKAGTVIYRRGDPVDGCYFIAKGSISMLYPSKKDQKDPILIKAPDFFGVLEIVQHINRIVSVSVVEDIEVGFLDIETFKRLKGSLKETLNKISLARKADVFLHNFNAS